MEIEKKSPVKILTTTREILRYTMNSEEDEKDYISAINLETFLPILFMTIDFIIALMVIVNQF